MVGVKTFAHVYIVEVDDGDQSPGSANDCLIVPDSRVVEDVGGCGGGTTDLQSNKSLTRSEGDGAWVSRLQEAARRVVEAGGNAEVLGCW